MTSICLVRHGETDWNNTKEIQRLEKEIESLSNSAYSTVIEDFVSEELLQLKQGKIDLLKESNYYKLRYNRLNVKIEKSRNVEFEKLVQFFPTVNIEKIKSIEEFHEGISSILNKELLKAKKEMREKIGLIDNELNVINGKMEELLNPYEQPSLFLENAIETSLKLKSMQDENFNYERMAQIKLDIASKTLNLSKIKVTILKEISDEINRELKTINNTVHSGRRTPPELKLLENDYEYIGLDNTGTGKAYTNLMIFDLSIHVLTELPFIIHDSVLFKNIEKTSVENFIGIYITFEKQIFVAIDVINIYDKKTQKILNECKVLELSAEKLLFTLDWRDDPRLDLE